MFHVHHIVAGVSRALAFATAVLALVPLAHAQPLDGGVDTTASGSVPDAGTAPDAAAPAPDPQFDVLVRAPRPPRSASEAHRDRAAIESTPHRSADDVVGALPGFFVTRHGGEGKANQIFFRGFDAVHGQDLEITAGGIPVNDVSNVHGQGYADLHFIPVEVIREIVALPGTYDPRQGDFAVAGSIRLELGYDEPGVTARTGVGNFGTRRTFLAYRPPGPHDGTFAAAEFYQTDGFGPARAATRGSAISQLIADAPAGGTWRLLLSAATSRFSSAGVLRLGDVEAGVVDRFASYDTTQGGSSGRAQTLGEYRREGDGTTLLISTYLVLRSLYLRQNFTGFMQSPEGDNQQQINDAVVAGFNASRRMRVHWLSPRDSVEMGLSARSDWIEQSQRRVSQLDNRVTGTDVDARVRAHDVAGYLDLALRPTSRIVLRGGARFDELGYRTDDRGAGAAGQSRASQGLHVGRKGTIDLRLVSVLHGLLSFGEGFRSPQARSLSDGETTPFTRVTSAEAGLRWGGEVLTASLAGFHTRLSDDLVFDHATGRNSRVPATTRTGASLDAVFRPRSWIGATVGATYTRAVFRGSDAERRAGDLVPYAPQLVAHADGQIQHSFGRVAARFGTGVSWLARRPLPYGEMGHDVFLIDATAALRWRAVELRVDLWNALDAHWYDGEFVYASRWNPAQAADLVPQRHVTVGAPRSALVSLALFL